MLKASISRKPKSIIGNSLTFMQFRPRDTKHFLLRFNSRFFGSLRMLIFSSASSEFETDF